MYNTQSRTFNLQIVMMFQTIRKVSFSTKYLKIIHIHLIIHVVILLSDCPKWKEEHGCKGSLMRNLCKKTCGLCGGRYVLYFHIMDFYSSKGVPDHDQK